MCRAELVEELAKTMSALSAPGSALLLEHLGVGMLGEAGREQRAVNKTYGIEWFSARDDLVSWLAGHGWDAKVFAHNDPRIGHGARWRRTRRYGWPPACWPPPGLLAHPPRPRHSDSDTTLSPVLADRTGLSLLSANPRGPRSRPGNRSSPACRCSCCP